MLLINLFLAYLQIIESRFSSTDYTQQTLLSTWLVEIYLYELNSVYDSSSYKSIKDSLRDWFKLKLNFLDKVIYFYYKLL